MKVIFLYSRENRYSFNALAGALEKTPEIFSCIDLVFASSEKDLLEELKNVNSQKTVICLSYSTMQIEEMHATVKAIKSASKEAFIIAGGPHPSGNPYNSLEAGIDVVVRGEGEILFPELLWKILRDEDIYQIQGIAYLNKENEYIYNKKEHTLIEIDDFAPFSERFRKFGPIEITRGCPFACKYCQTSFLLGTKPRHRSVESILEHVAMMKKNNLYDFRVITPNAFSYASPDGRQLNLLELERLLFSVKNTLGEKGRIFFGSFPSEVRPEHVTEETLSIAKQYIKNDNLIIGAQTGSRNLLKDIHRQHSLEDVYIAVDLARKYDFKVNIDFIFGLPNETENDVKDTLEMIKNLHNLYNTKGQANKVKIHGHTFMPLPQTPFKNEKGGQLSLSLKKELQRLQSSQILYGEWEKQDKFGSKL